MNVVIKPDVKKDLDRYVDIVDTASGGLKLLKQKKETQEQIDEGYGTEEADKELETINSKIDDLKQRWKRQVEKCGRTNSRESVKVPLHGTSNLDHENVDELSHEIERGKQDVKMLEKHFGVIAKEFASEDGS